MKNDTNTTLIIKKYLAFVFNFFLMQKLLTHTEFFLFANGEKVNINKRGQNYLVTLSTAIYSFYLEIIDVILKNNLSIKFNILQK